MKKLLGILALTALTTSLFAQGTVSFGNQTGLVKQWTSKDNSTVITLPKGTGYVQLFAAPKGSEVVAPMFTAGADGKQFANFSSLAAFLAANPPFAGGLGASGAPSAVLVNTGNGIFNGGTFTLQGVAGGASASYFALGWTGAATTFDLALEQALAGNALIGMSGVFTTATGDPLATPPGAAAITRNTFGGITLAPAFIPEPSTFALAGLGIAAMMIFRRRK
ncbi:MAG TPA: PEP-CTERM sorting domain-containing protein [Candidatus Paceibacterota bacterium]|nr:PEP-CTERM sorting domain-containing protein [Verrucomicrobiota bacterium]HSA11400.1 PEP-CTERM sorting domain-containing protein [Candidatus Paceibacterota bacterium]